MAMILLLIVWILGSITETIKKIRIEIAYI